MHGDTPRFRNALLATRWWLHHWKVYGDARRYRIELARDGRNWFVDVAASTQLPAALDGADDFGRQFGFAIRPGCGAVLKVGSFDGSFKARFLELTRAAFASLREQRIDTLFIDIRDNGGGDDDMWLQGLMPYLATQPYRTGSTYTKKVVETNLARGETAGQIVHGEIATWQPADNNDPLHFKGKVVVLIGPSTYSSAILFANVIADFGIGTLAGSGEAARRTQSGGIRKFTLPHSGLALWVPRFVLAPPSGAPRDALLAPSSVAPPACAM